jgi:hypothetical protein
VDVDGQGNGQVQVCVPGVLISLGGARPVPHPLDVSVVVHPEGQLLSSQGDELCLAHWFQVFGSPVSSWGRKILTVGETSVHAFLPGRFQLVHCICHLDSTKQHTWFLMQTVDHPGLQVLLTTTATLPTTCPSSAAFASCCTGADLNTSAAGSPRKPPPSGPSRVGVPGIVSVDVDGQGNGRVQVCMCPAYLAFA